MEVVAWLGVFFPLDLFQQNSDKTISISMILFILEVQIFGLSHFVFKDSGVRLSTWACLTLFAQFKIILYLP